MNITELDSYNLADAVKFHNRLNPRLWGPDEHLLPQVRQKLLEIAADFQEFLGVSDLELEDITVSGSNAAYSYTPHSDIDLHLVVRMPEDNDEVYQELFNAKKYQYNDVHDIRIHGADVELYVQPADESPVSLGEYSVLRGEWIQVPRRKRANIDQSVVRHKYEDLKARIENALNDDDSQRIQALASKIKEMRRAGLDAHGEFGPENLAYKMLRAQGYIARLYKAIAAARDRELSLTERRKKKSRRRVKYGYGGWFYPGYNFDSGADAGAGEGGGGESLAEVDTGMAADSQSTWDGVSPDTDEFLSEDDNDQVVRQFIDHVVDHLGIQQRPEIKLYHNGSWSRQEHSFGKYEPDTNVLHVNMADRHVMDILRTVAHELVHCRQQEISPLPDHAGETGSRWENQANAVAGQIMRDWAQSHPELFESSGYIPTEKQKNDPRFSMALTQDVRPGQTGREANKLGLKTNSQGQPDLLIRNLRNQLREFKETGVAQAVKQVVESQDLFEINMSDRNLRRLVRDIDARAGIEFEMIVPGLNLPDDDDEGVLERDMSQDESVNDIDDAVRFFDDGEYNSARVIRSLRADMLAQYDEWREDKIDRAWRRDGRDFLRDYIINSGSFDRDEAETQARAELIEANPDLPSESEEFQKLLDNRIDELQEEFVDQSWNSEDSDYDEARELFVDDMADEVDESDWLEDERLRDMSDILDRYDVEWPYWTDPSTGREGTSEKIIGDVARDFQKAIGRPVNYSTDYHGGERRPGAYVVEPDGSLEADKDEDGGLEFVSPALPLDEMLSDLEKVREWAKQRGCYTNDSTGLHMNVSVPNTSIAKLDYVKLALLLGDERVLSEFGRSANTYTKSAMGKIRDMLKSNPESAQRVMEKMRGHMEALATKVIHSGETQKYTSINTKGDYVEFRSPGGDWLDANWSLVTPTLLRTVVALDAAMDPNKYRQEYQKKLYKLLDSSAQDTGDADVVQLFSEFAAGKLDKSQLIKQVRQQQLQRATKRNPTGELFNWQVGPRGGIVSMQLVAPSRAHAIRRAQELEPDWRNIQATVIGKYTRPESTDGEWGVWSRRYNRFMLDPRGGGLLRFDQRREAMTHMNSVMPASSVDRLDLVVQQIPDDYQAPGAMREPAGQQTGSGLSSTTPRGPGPWELYRQSTGRRIRGIDARDRTQAQAEAEAIIDSWGSPREDFGVRTVQNQGDWGFWVGDRFARVPGHEDASMPIRRFTSREAAEQYLEQLRSDHPVGLRNNIEIRQIPADTAPETSPSDQALQRAAAANARYNSGDLTPRGPGPWEIYRLSDNAAIRALDHTNRQAAETEARSALGFRGEDPALYGVRTRDVQPTSRAWNVVNMTTGRSIGHVIAPTRGDAIDQANSVIHRWQSQQEEPEDDDFTVEPIGQATPAPSAQPAPAPAGTGEFTGEWKIVDSNGQELHRFGGVGNVQADANRVAVRWLQQNPRYMQAGVEVVPVMSNLQESVVPGFDVYKATVRAKTPGGSVSTEVAIFAKNVSMAKQLLQAQFGHDAVISGVTRIS